MKKKAVFFDADGTVCDIKKGVPDSAAGATIEKDGMRLFDQAMSMEGADYVTNDMFHYGIRNGLEYLKLI